MNMFVFIHFVLVRVLDVVAQIVKEAMEAVLEDALVPFPVSHIHFVINLILHFR